MLVVLVGVAVVVFALLVLGVLGYGLLGAAGRLAVELRALEAEVRPVLTEAQDTLARVAAQRTMGG